jgi:Peptidase_C39 like family
MATATLVPTRTDTVLPSATATPYPSATPFPSATPTVPSTLTSAPTLLPTRTATVATLTFGQPGVLPPPLAHVEPLSPVASLQPVDATVSTEGVLLNVPFRSQYDSTAYQYSNCGPTALAMVLEAFGLNVPNDRIRAIANQLQGTTDVKDGIALDYLVQIGQEGGLRAEGLLDANGHYHQWTMGDVIREIRAGNPVVTLVHFAALPAHATSGSTADHYVVVVGLTGDGFIINDPASVGNEGYHQELRPDQLLAAWNAASIKNQAVAFLPPVGHERLRPIGGPVDKIVLAGVPTPGVASVAAAAQAAPALAPLSAAPAPISANRPSRAALPPPPNATFVSYSLGLHDWQRPSVPATVAPSSAPSTAQPDQPLVLAEHSSDSQSALPIAIVVVLIGAGALAIVKAPRGDDFDRLR